MLRVNGIFIPWKAYFYYFLQMDSSINHDHSSQISNLSPETDEVNRIKTGHVLTELLETERLYVSELLSIITVSTSTN